MKTISLKIDNSIFGETERILDKLKKPRNRYINEALEFYNNRNRRLLLKEALRNESKLVRSESMSVLKEFEEIEDAD